MSNDLDTVQDNELKVVNKVGEEVQSDNDEKEIAEKIEKIEGKLKNIDAKLSALEDDVNNKEYILDMGNDVYKDLVDFIRNNSKWTYQESLILMKTVEKMDENLDADVIKMEYRYYSAIATFLSRAEGVGLEEAEKMSKFYEPINTILGKLKKIEQEVEVYHQDKQKLEYYLASLREGYNREDIDISDL